MRITTTSRYGVRAVFDVAYHGRGNPVQIKDIARRQKISQRYLEQIFNKLLKAGLLSSKRGPRGGYLLGRPPSEISVGDIVTAAQGTLVPIDCLAEEAVHGKNCDCLPTCVTRRIWDESRRLLMDYYQSVSISELCSQAREKGVTPELDHNYMYFI